MPDLAVYSWTAFDSIKKAFSLGIVSLGFPFVLDASFGHEPGRTEWVLGVTLFCGNIAAGLVATRLGRLADRGRLSSLITLLVLVTAVSINAMSLALPEQPWIAVFLFFIGYVSFQFVVLLYDSLLVRLAPKEQRTFLSSSAWGWGFLGGLVVLVGLSLARDISPQVLRTMAAIIGGLLVILGLNLAQRVYVHPELSSKNVSPLLKYKKIRWILFLIFLIYDGIDTLTVFVPLFAKREIGLDTGQVTFLLIIMHLVAIPSTLIAGNSAKRIGIPIVLSLLLSVWSLVCFSLFFARGYMELVWISIATGCVIGGTKALARGWLAESASTKQASELFGLGAMATRGAAIFGPLLFPTIAAITGSMATAFLFHVLFFVLAFLVVVRLAILKSEVDHE